MYTTAMNDEEQRLGIELMKTQIDLYRQQARWETLKAVATFATAVVATAALILAVAHIIK
jgi:hypothetical protein